MPDFAEQNVFEMFVANRRQPFWLRRTTWGNTCAKVVDVGEFKRPPPYCGNPRVFADIYDLHTGALKERTRGCRCPEPTRPGAASPHHRGVARPALNHLPTNGPD